MAVQNVVEYILICRQTKGHSPNENAHGHGLDHDLDLDLENTLDVKSSTKKKELYFSQNIIRLKQITEKNLLLCRIEY